MRHGRRRWWHRFRSVPPHQTSAYDLEAVRLPAPDPLSLSGDLWPQPGSLKPPPAHMISPYPHRVIPLPEPEPFRFCPRHMTPPGATQCGLCPKR